LKRSSVFSIKFFTATIQPCQTVTQQAIQNRCAMACCQLFFTDPYYIGKLHQSCIIKTTIIPR